ncbi:tyrosinase family oxidase copper chaperone [Streptomyces sp. NPDC093085]|uniref:tyrosinase family oxidase copper chaperone n=1 Tax=Streptomyces sp. NPDC093085 TaxID=3155068 RepID=UPI00344211C1
MPGGTPAATTPPRSRAPYRTRRHVLRALFTLATVAGTSAALVPVVLAGRDPAGRNTLREPHREGSAPLLPGPPDGVVVETYRGRHIHIGPDTTARAATAGRPGTPGVAPPEILIDGRPLQVMRRADGSYLTVADHSASFPTPLHAARAAVDALAGAPLALAGPLHGAHPGPGQGPGPHI